MVKKYMDRREKKGWTVEQALQKAHEDTDLNLKFEAQTQGWNIQAAGDSGLHISLTVKCTCAMLEIADAHGV